jgi:transposase
LRPALLEQIEQIRALSEQIKALERQIGSWQRRAEECRRIMEIPGVGLLTATAAIATMGAASSFRSGREFAAFVGLVPRHSGTGGRVKLLGISKRGDKYLRTLLIHGARTVLAWQRQPGRQLDPWLKGLLGRRAPNVVIVASPTRWRARSGHCWLMGERINRTTAPHKRPLQGSHLLLQRNERQKVARVNNL